MASLQKPSAQAPGWQKYYTDEELRFGRWLLKADVVGTPLFVGFYFFLGSLLEQTLPEEHSVLARSTPTPVLYLQGLLAVVGCAVFFYHTQMLPPNAEDSVFHAEQKIGRWLFLTRHCLVLQAIHLSLSLLASAAELESLQRRTDGVSLFVGTLGCFVTVQYFALVHRHPDFKEKCAAMAQRSPPYDFSTLMIALHVPALPLAFLDIGLAKSHQVLATDMSIAGTAWMCLGYVCFYVILIAVNHRATGEWPYGVLEDLGGSLPKWAAFIAAQTVILYVFGIILFGVSRLPDAWTWPST